MKIIVPIKPNISKKKIFKSFKKIQKNLFYLAIIELILLLTNFANILSFLYKNNALRKLQYYDNNYHENSGYTTNNGNNNKVKKTKSSELINPIILIFFVFFILFLSLCLYIICEIKKIGPEKVTELIKDNIYKFIYMANSGFFFTAISYSPMANDLSVGYITLLVSGLIFFIGSIALLKNLSGNCFNDFTIFDKLKNYFILPCEYVWPFIALTDPCCECTRYSVFINSDGTTTSTKTCVQCWNYFILIVKRLILFISTILFYCFLIFLTVILLIIKLFYLLITKINKCCCQSGKTNNQNANPNIPNNVADNGNLETQQKIGNNETNPKEKKLDSTEQLENQIVNYIIRNQIQNSSHPSEERINENNQTTKVVSCINLTTQDMPNQNIDKSDIINIKKKEN